MADEIQGNSQTAPDTATQPAPAAAPDVNAIVNQAITGHMKRFIEKQLPGMFESALKPIHERFAAAPAQAVANAQADSKKTPEYAALEQKLHEIEKRATANADRASAAEKKQREDRAFSELRQGLTGKILPDFQDMVASHLFQVQKALDFEEDGTPVFTMRQKTAYGDEDLRLPIKDGIDAWLKSDAAKPFIAPPGSSSASPKPRSTGPTFTNTQQFDPKTASDEEKILNAMEIARAIETSRR